MIRTLVPLLALGVLMVVGPISAQQSGKPRVPPGRDPGGVAVALFTGGIDYTLPQIATRLARDGEGEPIAWDYEDNDNRPFDKSRGTASAELGSDGTAIAGALLEGAAQVRLIVVRVDPAAPPSLGRGVVFVAQTPARIVAVSLAGATKETWEPFRQAATHFKDVLFIVAAPETPDLTYPAALALDNVLAVAATTQGGERTGFGGVPRPLSGHAMAIAGAVQAAAGLLAGEPRLATADLRRRLVESAGGPAWRPRR